MTELEVNILCAYCINSIELGYNPIVRYVSNSNKIIRLKIGSYEFCITGVIYYDNQLIGISNYPFDYLCNIIGFNYLELIIWEKA